MKVWAAGPASVPIPCPRRPLRPGPSARSSLRIVRRAAEVDSHARLLAHGPGVMSRCDVSIGDRCIHSRQRTAARGGVRLATVRRPREESAVALMLVHFEVDDYDTWKPLFDADPAGRAANGAISHMVSRAVDNPNEASSASNFPRWIRRTRSAGSCSPLVPSSAPNEDRAGHRGGGHRPADVLTKPRSPPRVTAEGRTTPRRSPSGSIP